MEKTDATYPMELANMDYLTIEDNEGGKDVNILVIMDHFTHYVQAVITSSKQANTQLKNYGTRSLSIMGFLKRF